MSDSIAEQRIAAARSGDQQAFGDLVEPYRAELLVHCYRLLGSVQDAEDMVQETFLRAWNRLDRFTGGQYFRAWLYKIATNNCLDVLDKRSRRGLPPATFPPADPRAAITPALSEPVWLEPFPDELLPEATLGPEARYTLRESITLAFLAALQLLPPRQRVILILCDVLDWSASEAAQLLDITVAAVNGLLRRSRSTMNAGYQTSEPARSLDHGLRAVLDRYVEAWESGDVENLVALLADKVVFTMPPSPTWFAGRAAVQLHAQRMFSLLAQPHWQLQLTRANGQIAFACYRRAETGDRYLAHALQVLTLAGEQITEIHMFFLPEMFPRFGLATERDQRSMNPSTPSEGSANKPLWPDDLDALVASPDQHTLLFENERVRVLDTHIPAGVRTPVHTHRWPGVLYILSWSDFVRYDDQGQVLVDSRQVEAFKNPPQVAWSAPLPPHSFENIGATEFKIVTIELKDSPG